MVLIESQLIVFLLGVIVGNYLDFLGVFVMAIYLDDGEPIDNVPRSVTTEGHKILLQERTGVHWTVIIEKGV